MPLPPNPTSLNTNDLIDLYVNGDSQAAEVLITKFSRYLDKWVRLLTSGRWNPQDSEIHHFLSMLGSVDINSTAQLIANKMKAYEKEDVEQEIKLVFLETILRFRNIRKYFRYLLQRRVKYLFQDPLVFSYHASVPFEDSKSVDSAEWVDIDGAWVEGVTCGIGFDDLSQLERRVIQLNKWYGYSVEVVAGMLGVSTSTVNRILAKARLVLKVYYP